MKKINPYYVFLVDLLRDLRLTANGFQDKYNIKSFSTIMNKLKNDPEKKLHPETIGKIEEALQIKIDDVTDPTQIKSRKIEPEVNEFEDSGIRMHSFPVVTKVFAGGSPMMFVAENVAEFVSLPYEKKENCFAVIVKGDSMNHIIQEGDIVLVDIDKQAYANDIVILRLKDGRQLIKRMRPIDQNKLMFYSDNLGYEPLIIEKSEIEAYYKVVGIWKRI
jgi:SOS-response transcriptional repressor LexA